jgi:hypothetical protein
MKEAEDFSEAGLGSTFTWLIALAIFRTFLHVEVSNLTESTK